MPNMDILSKMENTVVIKNPYLQPWFSLCERVVMYLIRPLVISLNIRDNPF